MILNVLPLLSRPSRQGASAILLPGFAFLAVTALLTIVVGGAQTFWRYDDKNASFYITLAVIALILLSVPLVSLGAAAARLSARRRDDRLAILRLLGATGRSTARLAVVEATVIALVGAMLGVLTAYAVSPLVGLIHFRGEAIGATGVAVPLWGSAGLVVFVALVAAISARLSLRRVIISPLGVVTKQSAPKMPWVQALLAFGAILLVSVLMNSIDQFGGAGAMTAVLGIGFGMALLSIDLIGAWVLSLFGRAKARRSQKPEDLLAARFVLESPRAAWRQVSGVAMSSFVAVMAGSGIALMDMSAPSSTANVDPLDRYLVADITTGIMITVIGTFVMVACSVAVNQAAQILDRKDVSRSLDVMGMPLAVQDAARRKATMLPLLLASVGSAILGGIVLFPLVGMALLFAPLSLAVTLSSIVIGIVVVTLTLRATRPLLRQVVSG